MVPLLVVLTFLAVLGADRLFGLRMRCGRESAGKAFAFHPQGITPWKTRSSGST